MILSKLGAGRVLPSVSYFLFKNGSKCVTNKTMKSFASEAKASLKRSKIDTAHGPFVSGDKIFGLGQGFLAAGSGLALGALCFYGLGLSSGLGAVDKAGLWPAYIRHRVRDTYLYFGSSLGITAGTAVAVFRNNRAMSLMTRHPILSTFGAMFAAIGVGTACRAIPYDGGLGAKQVLWAGHCALLGTMLAPMLYMGGPLLIRAAYYTTGAVGGLSALALCAPSDRFLRYGGALGMGLGVVFVSTIGTWFLPPTTALGASVLSISVYGGLVLFGAFLLYDTQRIIHKAETHPIYAERAFDPISESISIYLDTLNIFMRIAFIMAGGGGRRK